MTKAKPTKAATRKPDRVAVTGGAACPRCCAQRQRYRRPKGYKPKNETPFLAVLLFDRCSCGWIQRLEELP
jgi:hypothetical protein